MHKGQIISKNERKRTGKQKTKMDRMTGRRGERMRRNRGKETPAAVTQHLSPSQTHAGPCQDSPRFFLAVSAGESSLCKTDLFYSDI